MTSATDNRMTELLQELRDLAADVNPSEIIDKVSITRMGWTFDARWLDSWHRQFDRIADELEQAIAATLGSERGTCHAESDLSEWVCSKCQCWVPLGLTPENIMHASEWRYCPHCGARVEAVER